MKIAIPNSLLFFRNLPCSATNLLMGNTDRVLWHSTVSRIIALYFRCLLTGYSILLVLFTKLSFILFMVRCFFLLIHFLLVEDYELPKSTSHFLSVPLNLECIRIPSRFISFFFYFNCLPDDVLCKIAISADDNALNSSRDKPSDLSQQVVI